VCDAANNGPDVLKPVDRGELPGAGVVAAVRGDWAAATGCDAATAAAADFEGNAEWFRTLLLRNIEERFVAPVDVNEVVEVNPRFMSIPETGVERVRESPALAILARVAAIFYMRPPAEGQASDGLPLPVHAFSSACLPCCTCSASSRPRTGTPSANLASAGTRSATRRSPCRGRRPSVSSR
jgi:hypothetical protein